MNFLSQYSGNMESLSRMKRRPKWDTNACVLDYGYVKKRLILIEKLHFRKKRKIPKRAHKELLWS